MKVSSIYDASFLNYIKIKIDFVKKLYCFIKILFLIYHITISTYPPKYQIDQIEYKKPPTLCWEYFLLENVTKQHFFFFFLTTHTIVLNSTHISIRLESKNNNRYIFIRLYNITVLKWAMRTNSSLQLTVNLLLLVCKH